MKNPKEKITYGTISEGQDKCSGLWASTYDEALYEAKQIHQAWGKPVYIVERTEHFEIVGGITGEEYDGADKA